MRELDGNTHPSMPFCGLYLEAASTHTKKNGCFLPFEWLRAFIQLSHVDKININVGLGHEMAVL